MIAIPKLYVPIPTDHLIVIVKKDILEMVEQIVSELVIMFVNMGFAKVNLITLANVIWDGTETTVPKIVDATITLLVQKERVFVKNVWIGRLEKYVKNVSLEVMETQPRNKAVNSVTAMDMV